MIVAVAVAASALTGDAWAAEWCRLLARPKPIVLTERSRLDPDLWLPLAFLVAVSSSSHHQRSLSSHCITLQASLAGALFYVAL